MERVRRLTGIDLSHYKRPQMERRLAHLRDRRGFSDFASYAAALSCDASLLRELVDRITIQVSEFFRNPERWADLKAKLEVVAASPFRAWSAGCAHGEEPYSLAMVCAELGLHADIWATDVDERALEQALHGVYSPRALANVSPDRLQRFFEPTPEGWRVSVAVRQCVRFERHNLLADPYPRDLDLIVCRNLLIYLTDAAKQRIIAGFSQALKPGGHLFVGSTEQLVGMDACGLRLVAPFLYQKADGP
ncbi:CheR family methyltransferase [Alicyclobacillus acidocaldarius]|uniref:protein-glutamate O-methyltransferase n=1 Tax=Alicyclobacillus acidocaldarius (strain Tc-4-1) TaxID=1048834 RepID=F8IK04_ALIAT|nr:protein-glutamate O-methyltransferase CheR [Alicyclobacillus acidocaldarius]AEJ43516.1 MCP methyltransferase, CheR-type [Alicyclobacillus acidocaldarius subsp. acidocaldarius Tc-4-1]